MLSLPYEGQWKRTPKLQDFVLFVIMLQGRGLRNVLAEIGRIIEPLASRCAKFRFKPLDPTNTRQRIEYIALQENVQLEHGVFPNKYHAHVFRLSMH
jgi:hypothetical protein